MVTLRGLEWWATLGASLVLTLEPLEIADLRVLLVRAVCAGEAVDAATRERIAAALLTCALRIGEALDASPPRDITYRSLALAARDGIAASVFAVRVAAAPRGAGVRRRLVGARQADLTAARGEHGEDRRREREPGPHGALWAISCAS